MYHSAESITHTPACIRPAVGHVLETEINPVTLKILIVLHTLAPVSMCFTTSVSKLNLPSSSWNIKSFN